MSDFSRVRQAIVDLGKIAPATRTGLRVGMARAGDETLAAARAGASWSSRIPAATTVNALTGANVAGVGLRVSAALAPHAAAYEGRGGATFDHPVFGTDVWVTERTRPFLRPAAARGRVRAEAEAVAAIRQAGRAAGFR